MRLLMIAMIAAAVAAAQTPAAPPGNTPPGNAQNGKKLFAQFGCFQCHGYEAQGGLGTGPRLAPKPLPWAALSRYVRAPAGQMPPYTAKVVPDKDLADIYAFLSAQPTPPPAKNIPLLNN
jgi:mono/diheme cytochrome c family protein